jgi:hypothetical protein
MSVSLNKEGLLIRIQIDNFRVWLEFVNIAIDKAIPPFEELVVHDSPKPGSYSFTLEKL